MFKISQNQIKKWTAFILFVVAGAILNIAGSMVANVCLNKLLYLDMLGTVVVAIIGGYFPGILTAVISSFISFYLFPPSVFYLILNVFMAILTTFCFKKYYDKHTSSIKMFILYIIIISLVFSFFATMLTYAQGNAVVSKEGSIDRIILAISDRWKLDIYISHFITNFFINTIDKSLCTGLAFVVIRLIPLKVREYLRNVGWLQKPLSSDQIKMVEKRTARRMSINVKICLALFTACIVITAVVAYMSQMLFVSYMEDRYISEARGVSELAAKAIDPDMVDEFIEKGDDAKGYKKTEDLLYGVSEVTPNVQNVFVYKVSEDGYTVVFDIDTDILKGEDPGTHVDFDESVLPYVDSMLKGQEFSPYTTDDVKIGYYLTSFSPVYDAQGKCVCYAGVDISKRDLDIYEQQFMARLISLCLGFVIMIMAGGIWLSKYHIIYPVNTLVKTVEGFGYDGEEARKQNVEDIREIGIHTGDEIENLYFAFLQATEENMINYSYMLQNARDFDDAQSGLIIVLADLVENRDESTGDHIRKTAAYTGIIMKKMREMGYYKEELTDSFITNVIKSAPLHDVGKIRIPDNILNKPGRLTEEEFEIMKKHAEYGGEVVEQCIFMLPKAHYLSEARKIAEFHHEKWNGKGYPHGLSGEDIPLSARIMAVADVFDALVSHRVYKPAFDFDDAMDIIEKDAGSHFDPKVAEAFLAAREEVRETELSFRNRERENEA
ncbi:MAG: HD domain-containing protein [Lachnospiraceae bacterium]|nr:HD domain-containing protein [Lachnospiraceae bacterium]